MHTRIIFIFFNFINNLLFIIKVYAILFVLLLLFVCFMFIISSYFLYSHQYTERFIKKVKVYDLLKLLWEYTTIILKEVRQNHAEGSLTYIGL